MAVTVGPIGSAPTPTVATIGDKRIDLTTGTIWRNSDGRTWSADSRAADDVIAALLAEPTSLSRAAIANIPAVAAKISQTTTQTGVVGQVAVNFGTASFNQGCIVSPASRIEIVTSGVYVIAAKAWWNGGSGVRSIIVNISGTYAFEVAATSNGDIRAAGSDVLVVPAGALITASSYSDSVTDLRAGSTATTLAVTRIGS